MFLHADDTLRGQAEGGWALEIESFLGAVKWHRADRLVPCVNGYSVDSPPPPPPKTLWTAGIQFHDLYRNDGTHLLFNFLSALPL
jgi:hypothetical protein